MAIPKLPASKTTVQIGAGGVVFVFWDPIRTLFEIGADWGATLPGLLAHRLDFLVGGNFQFGILYLVTLAVGHLLGRKPADLMPPPADSSESGDANAMTPGGKWE